MKHSRNIFVLTLLIFLLLCSDAAFAIGPKKKKQKSRRKAKTEKVTDYDSEEIDWGTTTVLTDIKTRAYQDSDSLEVKEDVIEEAEQTTITEEEAPLLEEIDNPVEAPKAELLDFSSLPAKVADLLSEAFSHIGTRYVYGASGPSSFDCSGFTSYCFRKIDISLPHNSGAQNRVGKNLEFMDEIRPGDLVFFRGRSVASSIGHVGIVTEVMNNGEDFRFIHASTSSGVIVSRYTENYYHIRYIGARRVIKED